MYDYTPDYDEKAWLFHRGRWSWIKNPLYRRKLPGEPAHSMRQNLRQILQDYNLQWWILGPTFLLPHYSGTLIYTYARSGEGKGPEYLVWIDTVGAGKIIFAQDLPDLVSILALLVPIVCIDILIDMQKKWVNFNVTGQNNGQEPHDSTM